MWAGMNVDNVTMFRFISCVSDVSQLHNPPAPARSIVQKVSVSLLAFDFSELQLDL